jgi:hypothetical protein
MLRKLGTPVWGSLYEKGEGMFETFVEDLYSK